MESSGAIERVADRFAALASPLRIQIVRLLLAAHKLGGMTVGDIQGELRIAASTLTHHLERLKHAGLIETRKDRQWIWCSINTKALQEMLEFLYQECCSRNVAVSTEWRKP